MLENNYKIAKYQIHEYWLDIGVVEDYEEVQGAYNTHFKRGQT
jgi:NDP-sugar pyrophosphorylase family protein